MTVDAIAAERRVNTGRAEWLGPLLVFAILIAATIPWRGKTYYEGGADPVVLAKAALSLLGLGIAALLSLPPRPRTVVAAPLLFLLTYLTCTVLGGWAAGTPVAGMVVAVRVVILAVTAMLLVRRYEPQLLIGCLIGALGAVGLAGALSGLPTLSEGRLAGVTPRLHPNELALICALVIVWCLWRAIDGRDTVIVLGVLVAALAALVGTGSRTPMLALGFAGLTLLLSARAVRLRTLVLAAVVIPLTLWVVAGTGILQKLVLRDQSIEQVSSLSNRTIAWTAALGAKDSVWLEWLGGGLSMKQVEVPGQWWNTQILDSSWISAIVQGGWIGLGVCLAWAVYSLVRSFGTPIPFRALQQAIIVFLIVRGVFESGLFDATTAFLMFFVTVLAMPTAHSRGRPT